MPFQRGPHCQSIKPFPFSFLVANVAQLLIVVERTTIGPNTGTSLVRLLPDLAGQALDL